MKVSLKENHLVTFYISKKLVLCKEDRETFWDIIFYIFDKEEKEFRKSIKRVLMKKF